VADLSMGSQARNVSAQRRAKLSLGSPPAFNMALAADSKHLEGTAPTRDITSVAITSKEDVLREEFKHFSAKGVFVHHEELTVGPRSLDGESGFYVVTPFMLLDDDNTMILVNRGW
jgi:cytochrome oxidase assembly protein ShyY1